MFDLKIEAIHSIIHLIILSLKKGSIKTVFFKNRKFKASSSPALDFPSRPIQLYWSFKRLHIYMLSSSINEIYYKLWQTCM